MEEKIVKMIEDQINRELESAYLYLDFSNIFCEKGLNGFSHWYRIQAREEIEHAERFIAYLHDSDETVALSSIDKLECETCSEPELLNKGLKHEEYITSSINAIYELAGEVNDIRTLRFLDWFINEQAEEEKNARDLIDRYRLFASDCPCGLYQLDSELGERAE